MPRPALLKSRPPPDITTGLADVTTNRYFIKKVIDAKLFHGQLYFLVKWVDWPSKYNTWEPLEHLNKCTDKINLFFEKKMTDPDLGNDMEMMELKQIYIEKKSNRISDMEVANSKQILNKKKRNQSSDCC